MTRELVAIGESLKKYALAKPEEKREAPCAEILAKWNPIEGQA